MWHWYYCVTTLQNYYYCRIIILLCHMLQKTFGSTGNVASEVFKRSKSLPTRIWSLTSSTYQVHYHVCSRQLLVSQSLQSLLWFKAYFWFIWPTWSLICTTADLSWKYNPVLLGLPSLEWPASIRAQFSGPWRNISHAVMPCVHVCIMPIAGTVTSRILIYEAHSPWLLEWS